MLQSDFAFPPKPEVCAWDMKPPTQPDEKYQITSGTSFSAAYVSGLVALMLEREKAFKIARQA